METMDQVKVVHALEAKKSLSYGTLLGATITWKLVKVHKDNDKGEKKIYLVDGFCFGVYIGQALMIYKNGDIETDFLSWEARV